MAREVWATIDYEKKMVTFEPKGENPFVFVGTVYGPRIPIIYVLRARDLLQGGCIGFLASVVDNTQVVPVGPEQTRLVCEFLDIFPKDLPGLPPHREIEFVIELALGIEPVSKAPYRMALAEMKELSFNYRSYRTWVLSDLVFFHGAHRSSL